MKSASRGDVRPLDLAGSERQLAVAAKGAERVGRAFGRVLKKTMPFLATMKATVEHGPAETVSLDVALEKASGVALRVDLATEDGTAWASLVVSAEAVSLILDATLGGKESFWEVALGPQLTGLQRPVVDRSVNALVAELAKCIAAESGTKMAPVSKALTQGRQGGDVIRVVVAIEGFPVPVAFTVFLAPSAFQAEKAGGRALAEAPANARMERAMEDVGVELVAELGRCSLGLKHLLSLRVGDVVRLSTAADDPVKVRIGGIEKFVAAPVISRGQVAVEIT